MRTLLSFQGQEWGTETGDSQDEPGALVVQRSPKPDHVLIVIVALVVLLRGSPQNDDVLIATPAGLDSYLENLGDDYEARGLEPPIATPTGVKNLVSNLLFWPVALIVMLIATLSIFVFG